LSGWRCWKGKEGELRPPCPKKGEPAARERGGGGGVSYLGKKEERKRERGEPKGKIKGARKKNQSRIPKKKKGGLGEKYMVPLKKG